MTPDPGHINLVGLIDAACSVAASNNTRSPVRLAVSGENSVEIVVPWLLLRQMVACWRDIFVSNDIVCAPEEDIVYTSEGGSSRTWVEGCDLKP